MHGFHRIVSRWFTGRYGAPTEPQERGWPHIRAGGPVLISAPTGTGKTLTAFLCCIDRLLREGLEGKLQNELRVLYISPLKALSQDVRLNLTGPLAELRECAEREGTPMPELRVAVRTGDTPASQRASMLRKPPHILVTTPESLFLLLSGAKSREMLRSIDTVIVDEIHALARDKRGSHFALSLARLDALCAKPPQRIGLSATQKPIEKVARFLVGHDKPCEIVNAGHRRTLDLGLVTPKSELSAVCSMDHWNEIYGEIQKLVESHQSTLIFVNTRKLAERVSYHLSQMLGEDKVAAHHGSLSRDRRFDAEARLKTGQLKAIVATASLELGIDVGFVDLVIQIGSPRSIATFLQRIGRAGHAVHATPKGRLIPLTRDELVESLSLLHAVKSGELDKIVMPEKPLDILAQHVVAASTEDEQDDETLYKLMQSAAPYHDLTRVEFDSVLLMLSDGFSMGTQGKKRSYLHWDRIHGKVRARDGARMAVAMNGGAIPEQGDYRVVTEGDGGYVGTVNEDFAIESGSGDVFLLGNTSWMVVGLKGSDLVVRDAHGMPPTIPFWLGEAPGRTVELSASVSRLRTEIAQRLDLAAIAPSDPLLSAEALSQIRDLDPPPYRTARAWLTEAASPQDDWAVLQAVHYVAVQKAALGMVPTQSDIVFERFFDDSGGMQLVLHAPFGMRINRGLGLALRKSFCRSFDFELQASADNDGIVLSLGPNQSFPLEALYKMVKSATVKEVLVQAILAVPLFQVRFRWNANRSLAVLRMQKGKRVAPALQRFRADDLLTSVFPQQTQCFEHRTGDLELPDHPLVTQTMHDCLTEAIDLEGLIAVLVLLESGAIRMHSRDTKEPSPFSYQLLNAMPYAFLDDAPLEERRARAVAQRRSLPLGEMQDLTRLDAEAIAMVGREAFPTARNADELYDVLGRLGVLEEVEAKAHNDWETLAKTLVKDGRATQMSVACRRFWVAAESVPLATAAYDGAGTFAPEIALPPALQREWTREDAHAALLRSALDSRGVVTAEGLAELLALPLGSVEATLPAIETTGTIIRGKFSGGKVLEWCERRLLMRIHRLTLDGLRKQIRPVTPEAYVHFLAGHQGALTHKRREGKDGALEALTQLAGFEGSAWAWEGEILPSRVKEFQPSWIDELMHEGELTWGRISPPERDAEDGPVMVGMHRTTPLAMPPRAMLDWLIDPKERERREGLLDLTRSNARTVYDALATTGAQFHAELLRRAGLLESQLDESLGELCRMGLAHADGYAALRPFVSRNKKQAQRARGGLSARFLPRPSHAGRGGRWATFPPKDALTASLAFDVEKRRENWAWLLLHRYGVVFRDLLMREALAPSWGELTRAFRRLEARGEIRGGRFVAGELGEQFALEGAVDALRKTAQELETRVPDEQDYVVVCAADPLNLVGVVTPGARIPSSRNILLVLQGGRHVASKDGIDVTFHVALGRESEARIAAALRLGGQFRDRYADPALLKSLVSR